MSQKPQPQQTVKLAIDCDTGEVLPAESLLTMTDTEFTVLRREAMTARIARSKGDGNAVRFQCAICNQPLFLSRRIGGVKNRWFTHDGKSESCPWYEGNHLTPDQTKALIYRGQQEGDIQIEGLQWSGMYFGNAAGAVDRNQITNDGFGGQSSSSRRACRVLPTNCPAL